VYFLQNLQLVCLSEYRDKPIPAESGALMCFFSFHFFFAKFARLTNILGACSLSDILILENFVSVIT
jgi:hypothetical protein